MRRALDALKAPILNKGYLHPQGLLGALAAYRGDAAHADLVSTVLTRLAKAAPALSPKMLALLLHSGLPRGEELHGAPPELHQALSACLAGVDRALPLRAGREEFWTELQTFQVVAGRRALLETQPPPPETVSALGRLTARQSAESQFVTLQHVRYLLDLADAAEVDVNADKGDYGKALVDIVGNQCAVHTPRVRRATDATVLDAIGRLAEAGLGEAIDRNTGIKLWLDMLDVQQASDLLEDWEGLLEGLPHLREALRRRTQVQSEEDVHVAVANHYGKPTTLPELQQLVRNLRSPTTSSSVQSSLFTMAISLLPELRNFPPLVDPRNPYFFIRLLEVTRPVVNSELRSVLGQRALDRSHTPRDLLRLFEALAISDEMEHPQVDLLASEVSARLQRMDLTVLPRSEAVHAMMNAVLAAQRGFKKDRVLLRRAVEAAMRKPWAVPQRQLSVLLSASVSFGETDDDVIAPVLGEVLLREERLELTKASAVHTLWALCAMGRYDLPVFEALWERALEAHQEESHLRKLSRVLLAVSLERPEWRGLEVDHDLREAARRGGLLETEDAASSELHERVSACLSDLGVPHRNEVQLLDHFLVDIAVEDSNLVIEVDGPSHFVTDGTTRSLNGKTQFKHRLLTKLGKRVASLDYLTVNSMTEAELQSRLEEITASS